MNKKIYIAPLFFSFFTLNAHAQELPCEEGYLRFQVIPGELIVSDPLAIKLIKSPAMQRLKDIYQYGVNEFVLPQKAYHYNRFEHSLGVYKIIKDKGASSTEQYAGLLHDVSHTVFSHTMDVYFMGGANQGAYQDQEDIHSQFINQHGLSDLLNDEGISTEEIIPDTPAYRCLEQPSPDLCADRIQYILQEAHLDGIMDRDEINRIYDDLCFENGQWFFKTPDLAERFAFISLTGTLNTWGSPENIVIAHWVSDLTKILLQEGKITLDQIQYSLKDQDMWHLMISSQNPDIQSIMHKIRHYSDFMDFPEEEDASTNSQIFYGKFRGVNPLVLVENQLKRLTEISPTYNRDYHAVKETMKQGWKVRLR